MNIAFRVDSSFQIGTGHVMRCLTLAESLRERLNAKIYFFCRKGQGAINSVIKDKGFNFVEMASPIEIEKGLLCHSDWLGATQEEDAEEFLSLARTHNIDHLDFLVIDHYAIDTIWHKLTRAFASKIFVIDDLGDREHDCDFLLDQTYGCLEEKYQGIVAPECQLMLGANYALLRKEFHENRDLAQRKRFNQEKATKLLITLGGVDVDNITSLALKAVSHCKNIDSVVVIAGNREENFSVLNNIAINIDKDITIISVAKNMSELMLEADICIGAAGSTSWERCVLGLPSINLVLAENQLEIAENLHKSGAAVNFGAMAKERINELTSNIDKLVVDSQLYLSFVRSAFSVCDGLGANRVSKVFV